MLATKCGLAHPRMKSECNTPNHIYLFKSWWRFEYGYTYMAKECIRLSFRSSLKYWSVHSIRGSWKIERKNPWKNSKKIGKKKFK